MKNIDELSVEIINDVANIWQKYTKIDALKNENKITESQFLKKVFLYLYEAQTLRYAVEEMEEAGMRFTDREILYLDELIDELGYVADIFSMDELTDTDIQAMTTLAIKYKDFLPEDFVEDSVELD